MTAARPDAVTLVFIGHADPDQEARAAAYEDAVLPLVAAHGGQVVERCRRRPGEDPSLPFEVHVIRFPDRGAYEAYLADDRRSALLAEFGDVFTSKQVTEVDPIDTHIG